MIRSLLLLAAVAASGADEIPRDGLLVDLDARVGLTVDAQGRVTKWTNQAGPAEAREFVGQDKGRKVPGSGLPAAPKVAAEGVGFAAQELVCHDEKAFDGLVRGDGCTWIAVLRPAEQRKGGLKDVNSFFGNLRNGGKYEGIWGCLDDDNTVWWGARNGLTFGRFDVNNPKVAGPKLATGKWVVVAGRLGAGVGEVPAELFVDDPKAVATAKFPVNPQADSSKLCVGQERDATQHPGFESFDGSIRRFLLWGRPLKDDELKQALQAVR
jgi:hypothetical protein